MAACAFTFVAPKPTPDPRAPAKRLPTIEQRIYLPHSWFAVEKPVPFTMNAGWGSCNGSDRTYPARRYRRQGTGPHLTGASNVSGVGWLGVPRRPASQPAYVPNLASLRSCAYLSIQHFTIGRSGLDRPAR